MTLSLNYTQRINLVAILDGMEVQGRREVWAICALQARIDLNDADREAIGLRRLRAADGREYQLWNNTNGDFTPFEIELNEADTDRVCRAMDNYRVVLARDRAWWEPLVKQLPQEENKALTPEVMKP